MSLRDLLSLSTRRLRRRWIRSCLGVLILLTGVAPLAMIAALRRGMREATVRGVEAHALPRGYFRVTRPRTSDAFWNLAPLTSSDVDRLQTLRGAGAIHRLTSTSEVLLHIHPQEPVWNVCGISREFLAEHASIPLPSDEGTVPILLGKMEVQYRWDEETLEIARTGLDPQALIGTEIPLVVGRPEGWIRPLDYDESRRAFRPLGAKELETRRLEKRASLSVRYDLSKLGEGRSFRGKVVGILPGSRCYVPLDDVVRWNAWISERNREALRPGMDPEPGAGGEKEPLELLVRVRNGSDPLETARAAEALGFTCESFELQLEKSLRQMGVLVWVAEAVALAVVLLGIIAAAATVSRTVADSGSDIGLYRALGATRGQVLSVFAFQAGLLGLLGGLLGVAVGTAAAARIDAWALRRAEDTQVAASWFGHLISVREIDVMPPTLFHFSPAEALLFVAAAAALCLLAGMIPAWGAARRDPIAALRAS